MPDPKSESAPQALQVQAGTFGLFYIIDLETPGLFIAGRSEEEAAERASRAKRVLETGLGEVEGHDLWKTKEDRLVFIPRSNWQTTAQAVETLDRLKIALTLWFDLGEMTRA